MISIDRSILRLFRTALRKTLFSERQMSRSSSHPSVLVQAGPMGLSLRAQHQGMALVWHDASPCPPAQIQLPNNALSELEGKGDATLIAEGQSIRAQWLEANFPHRATWDAATLAVGSLPIPGQWVKHESHLLAALHEAMLSTAQGGVRFALHRIQLHGESGEVIGTDGKQLLVQGGFDFPWEERLLIDRMQFFGWNELRHFSEFQLGRTDQQVCFSVGPWTLYLPIDQETRYPDVQRVVPKEGSTVLNLHEDDATFLSAALANLPDSDSEQAFVTLDLTNHVSMRRRDPAQPVSTEVRLSRSEVSGPKLQISLGHEMLRRALSLGFRKCSFTNAVSPFLFTDKHRKLVSMPFPKSTVVLPNDSDIRIDSLANHSNMAPTKATLPTARPSPRSQIRSNDAFLDLLKNVRALRDHLRQMLSECDQLVAGLRQHHRKPKQLHGTQTQSSTAA